MKILFFFPKVNEYKNFKPLINISNHLIKNGHTVHIASIAPPTAETTASYHPETTIKVKRNNQSKILWIKSLFNEDYDFLIGVQAHNGYWLSLLKTISKTNRSKKIISWEHSSPITSLKSEYKKTWPIWMAVRWILSFNTDFYICVSKGAKLEMESIIALQKKEKALYIPNMIYETPPPNTYPKNKKTTFLSLGRLAPEKGIHIAINALSRLKAHDFEYLIAGDGPSRKELEDLCNKTPHLKNKVKFLGYCSEINEIMQKSDVLLLPSYFEGLPTVLVEACINNTPIIASDCKTGPSEIVVQEKNGYLFKVGDSDDLLKKINQWIENRSTIKNSPEFAKEFGPEAGKNLINKLEKIT